MSTPAPQFTSTNVLDQPGTHPSRLNASAPSYDPTQTSTPPLLDATAPTSGAPIEPSTGMGAAPAPVLDDNDRVAGRLIVSDIVDYTLVLFIN